MFYAICIEQLPWQTYFEIVSHGLHYHVKQDRIKYRSLMYPNLDLETPTLFTIYFNRRGNSLTHAPNQANPPLPPPNPPQSLPYNPPWHPMKCPPPPSPQKPPTTPSAFQGTF